jgi:protein SCO1/2
VVSFDPTETAKDAAARKFEWVTSYGRAPTAQVEAGWAFLTSPVEGRVRELADAVGFQYRYLPASNEYAHPTAFFAITSDGVISRYLSGLDGSSKEMRLALFDAGEGRIGGVLDTFWQMCFTFDAHAGSYTLQAFRVMQIGAVGCVALVGGVVGSMLLVERRRRLARAAQAAVAAAGSGVTSINKGAPTGAPAGAV